MATAERNKVGAEKPNRGRGRPPGTPNKTTAALKDAILKAAELTGRDGKGKDGLTGYLRRVAAEDVKAFSGLLGKVLPMTVQGPGEGGAHLFESVEWRIVRPESKRP